MLCRAGVASGSGDGQQGTSFPDTCLPYALVGQSACHEAGLHLLEHDVPNPLDVASYLQEAARLRSALEALGGLEVWATETHFMLVCLRMGRASALKDYLAGEHGILIRDASNFDGLNEHFFRIAAQSREENDRLVKAIGQWLEEE